MATSKEKKEWAKKEQVFECGTCGNRITIVPNGLFPSLNGDATEFIGACGGCGKQTYFYFKDFAESENSNYELV